ncbi:hypothetical protein RhiirC2_851291 [Rhizophagus irregularis]|uniref:Uncharacterized protein n=1 Tax=Rhizophagus irregularis TaxID=588596 RepID=A0A2N1N461_9GLOM|nr:hypothetical protein RhiirC2_851291 [Rhizophagus irregularis]
MTVSLPYIPITETSKEIQREIFKQLENTYKRKCDINDSIEILYFIENVYNSASPTHLLITEAPRRCRSNLIEELSDLDLKLIIL